MLTLVEETLLLYWSKQKVWEPEGGLSPLHSADAQTLFRAAVLMELALRGRVRTERPASKKRQMRRRVPAIIAIIFSTFTLLACSAGLLSWVGPLHDLAETLRVVSIIVTLSTLSIGTAVMLKLSGWMVVVDGSLTGDEIVDEPLQAMQGVKKRRVSQWLYRGLTDKQTLLQFKAARASIERQLEEKGCLSLTRSGDGEDDRIWVNEQSELCQALIERLRTVLIAGSPPDARTLTLLLLITTPGPDLLFRRPSLLAYGTIDLFFSKEEREIARTRLRELLSENIFSTALIDQELYETLLSIRAAALDSFLGGMWPTKEKKKRKSNSAALVR